MSSPVINRTSNPTVPALPTRGTALMADDESVVLQLGEILFRQIGFSMLPAHDGREAVDLFSSHRDAIRIVVLDWTMPKLSGEECLSAIRSLDPVVPVILCSGHSEEMMAKELRNDRHTKFLSKPFSIRELQRMVNESVGTAL
jgi:two-component system cell cycle sensor histidine kinase/response regulator CckA